ncbi:MAG: hypothetical protein H0U74_04285 [Bradymonadaceae bacterium]|nr:hypothetical protein [Lujinxingiaceae bacterium]
MPGRIEACLCADLRFGVQICSAERSFEVCECPDAPETPDVGGGALDDVIDSVDDAGEDAAQSSRNACGGENKLIDAWPGEVCGECDDGVIVCDGGDALRCLGATPKNVCGQCVRLKNAPGDACGTCGQGSFQCAADGRLVCVNDTVLNECGGCSELAQRRNFTCEVGLQRGTWQCSGTDEMLCVGPGQNACAGSALLAGVPGAACGRCGGGSWQCDGQEQVRCLGSENAVNACGGCAPIADQLGASCGVCGGEWQCDGTEALICSRPLNLCGACPLLPSVPGESCGSGNMFACSEHAQLACVSITESNACGGRSLLTLRPGDPCGNCGQGTVICGSPDVTVCIGGASIALNACQGCTPLAQVPGASCGPDHAWTCHASLDAVSCDEVTTPAVGKNACGGSAPLAGKPATTCEDCGIWACEELNTDSLVCVGGSIGLGSDPDNCGACGVECASDEVCFGVCVPISVVCGPNTTWSLALGQCVNTNEVCGPNTVWDADSGQCVANPTVVCGQNTVWDEPSQSCVPGESICGPNTVYSPVLNACVVGLVYVGDCADPPALAATISADTILARGSCYRVPNNVEVRNGAHLTIQAGVTLIFEENRQFRVIGATISAEGEAASPIRFTASRPQPGWWRGVNITNSNSVTNLIEHIIVEYAGQAAWERGSVGGLTISASSGAVRSIVRNNTFRFNQGAGLNIESGAVTVDSLEANTMTGNLGPSLVISAELLSLLDNTSSFAGNGANYIQISGGEPSTSQTWRKLDAPYRFNADVSIINDATVTIEPGTRLEFDWRVGFSVGRNSTSGGLRAVGTDSEPIVFTGSESTPGHWNGIRFTRTLMPNLLEHVVVEYGGSHGWDNGAPAGITLSPVQGAVIAGLRNVTARHNNGYGVHHFGNYFSEYASFSVFKQNTMTGNALGPLRLPIYRIQQLDAASSFIGNDIDLVTVNGGAVDTSQTWPALDVPYWIIGNVNVTNDAILDLPPGSRVVMGPQLRFEISTGALRALGELGAPITFTGAVPVPGYWNDLTFNTSRSVFNRLQHVHVYHGGSAGTNLRFVNNTRLAIDHLTLADGLGSGVFATGNMEIISCNDVSYSNVNPPVNGVTTVWTAACGMP